VRALVCEAPMATVFKCTRDAIRHQIVESLATDVISDKIALNVMPLRHPIVVAIPMAGNVALPMPLGIK